MTNADDIDLSEIENSAADAIAAQPVLGVDISLDDLLKDQIKKDTTPIDPRKLRQIIFGSVGVLLLVIVLVVYAMQPKEGSMAYGICASFLELNIPYPHTVRHTDIEGSRTAVRIYFTHIDPFGEFKLQTIECKFGPDPNTGFRVTQIAFDPNRINPATRQPVNLVDKKTIERFNMSLATIMASDPYRVLPPDWHNPLVPKD
jgi:hypothetical protein